MTNIFTDTNWGSSRRNTILINGVISWIVLVFASGTIAFGQQKSDSEAGIQFPYQAIVANENATVRSGPGEAHYGTQELKQGAIVEVYRHDPNDWCAIRPLPNSFSLVPSESIKMTGDGVGVAAQDGVHVWVGTLLGPVEQPLWQVKLKQNEQVEILGEISYPTEHGFSTTWYQIYPPAGEFRWVKRSDLLRPDSGLNADAIALSTASNIESQYTVDAAIDSLLTGSTSRPRREIALVQGSIEIDDPFFVEREGVASGNPNNLGWRKATSAVSVAKAQSSAEPKIQQPWTEGAAPNDTRNLSSTSFLRTNQNINPIDALRPLSITPAEDAVIAPTVGNDAMSDRLRRVDISLASEIIKPAETWNLQGFTNQLLEIQSTAQSDSERLHANKLINKIDSLRKTQATLINTHISSKRGVPVSLGAVGTGVDADVQFGTTFDAYGWLNELKQDSGRLDPTYVLQDDEGKILVHIEPMPGLNLHRYLHTKIGVVGTRGFNQKFKLKHVMAERVVVLDKGQTNLR